eukprot:6209222-Pleurochrysis_carterae.AAC.3
MDWCGSVEGRVMKNCLSSYGEMKRAAAGHGRMGGDEKAWIWRRGLQGLTGLEMKETRKGRLVRARALASGKAKCGAPAVTQGLRPCAWV